MAAADLPNWNNPQRPVIIITSDCLDGYFTFPGMQGLGETFLKGANKGTVAHWSSTGLGLTTEHSILTDGFYDGLFIAGETAIGRAINYGKVVYFNSGSHSSLLYSFQLMADPAMQLMRPELSLNKTSLQATAEPGDTVEFVLAVANDGLYPSQVTITDTLPTALNYVSVESTVTTTVSTAGDNVIINLVYGSGPTDQGMAWGESAVITLTTQVDPAAGDGMVTNLALLGMHGLDISPGDESDTAQVDIDSPITSTSTPTASVTPSPTITPSPSATPSPSPSPSPTATSTPGLPAHRLYLPSVIQN
jgi:uncharacterized repeat protein (TIGR01451 family)